MKRQKEKKHGNRLMIAAAVIQGIVSAGSRAIIQWLIEQIMS